MAAKYRLMVFYGRWSGGWEWVEPPLEWAALLSVVRQLRGLGVPADNMQVLRVL